MGETAVIKFRAKRGPYVDTRGDYASWGEAEGYRIPALKHHHIATPRAEQGIYHKLLMSSRADRLQALTLAIMRGAGLEGRVVFLQDAGMEGVTIESVGSGLFANVTLVVDLKAMRGAR